MARSTVEVFEDHLRLRLAGRVEEDIEKNYSDEVLLLSPTEARQGKETLWRWAAELAGALPNAKFEYVAQQVNGEHAFLQWQGRSGSTWVRYGVDSFVIRDGRIVMQSVFYILERTSDLD